MIEYKDFLKQLNDLIPVTFSEDWDHTGAQTGRSDLNITTVLTALDCTMDVVREALMKKAQCIVIHHPIFFDPVYSLLERDQYEAMIRTIIQKDLAVISLHTNLDYILNRELAGLFGIKKTRPIVPKVLENPDPVLKLEKHSSGLGCGGELDQPVRFRILARQVKNTLQSVCLKTAGDPDRIIKRAAFCGGSGGSLINRDLIRDKYDILITSDIGYHDAQKAIDLGLCLIDAGHFETEVIMLPELIRLMKKKTGSRVNFLLSETNTNPFNDLIRRTRA